MLVSTLHVVISQKKKHSLNLQRRQCLNQVLLIRSLFDETASTPEIMLPQKIC
jgi:hypothetical protein